MLACASIYSPLEKSNTKVFFADDSHVIRQRLRELIDELENVHLVGEAGDASEAIEKLEGMEVDIVIIDIRMPGGNGMAVLKELKRRVKPPTIIVYTSFAYPQYQQAYLEAGADYFFDKARDTDRLMEVIIQNNHNKGAL